MNESYLAFLHMEVHTKSFFQITLKLSIAFPGNEVPGPKAAPFFKKVDPMAEFMPTTP
jgi:hypothetical protein